MTRPVILLAFLSLASPSVFADKPADIPAGALPTENAKAFQHERDLGVRFSEPSPSNQKIRPVSPPAATNYSGPGKLIKSPDAPKIKPRSVIARPES